MKPPYCIPGRISSKIGRNVVQEIFKVMSTFNITLRWNDTVLLYRRLWRKTRKMCVKFWRTTMPLVPRYLKISRHCPLSWKPELIYLRDCNLTTICLYFHEMRILTFGSVYFASSSGIYFGFLHQCNGYVIVVTFLSADFWWQLFCKFLR